MHEHHQSALIRFPSILKRYKPDEDRFVVMGHEDDEEFQTAFWAKMLRSLCDPGCVHGVFCLSHLGAVYCEYLEGDQEY